VAVSVPGTGRFVIQVSQCAYYLSICKGQKNMYEAVWEKVGVNASTD
jgi:hypothetical protein